MIEIVRTNTAPEKFPPRVIPVAEDIARFRIELERGIFLEGLPRAKWRQLYKGTLDKYPRITPYRAIFDLAIEEAEEANEQLNSLWSPTRQKGDDTQIAGSRINEQADSEVAVQLCKDFLEFTPQDPVKAIRGAITLRFMLSPNDLESLSIEHDTLHARAWTTFPRGLKFAVLILRSDEAEKEEFQSTLHELEHAKNRLLRKRHLPLLSKKLDLPNQLAEHLYRLEKKGEDASSETRAKDEILACFSFLPFKPFEDSDGDKMDQYSFDVLRLLTDEEGLHYFAGSLSEIDRLDYFRTIHQGVESFKKLFLLYRNMGSESSPGSLAINILEQFPLRSWPSIVRLINSRYSVLER